ncbi:hypothetical protein [Leptolyngbya ohadii]|uniref:hypothetical protein n=1 Tax=Leptolyngbya ohadii TaxID=1962290 RepID=UPI000B5A0AF1|nr:hypothetical protein [Leptolyngbya ohadii]
MNDASRYWRWVKLTAAGQRQVEDIAEARAFMQQQFPDPAIATNPEIQRRFMALMQSEDNQTRQLAECCLRCFISHQIESVCQDLASRFGTQGRFDRMDLLRLVLDDVEVVNFRSDRSSRKGNGAVSGYLSLASKILQTFDPEQSQLSTWTKRLIQTHPEVNAFLLDCGIYLASDWSLLNSTTSHYLKRFLAGSDLQYGSALLDSYHAVYRRDRLKQNCNRRKCSSPTAEQLLEMAGLLKLQTGRNDSPQQILNDLHRLADRVREERCPRLESIDDEQHRPLVDEQIAPETDENDRQNEFLQTYRSQLMTGLDTSIQQTIHNRVSYFKAKKPNKVQPFLKGLLLFHCRGVAMSKIAPEIQMKQQYQVSRLLELDELREDVKQNLLQILQQQIKALAAGYVSLSQLERLTEAIDTALLEQVDRVIEEARVEASTGNRAKEPAPKSLFSRRLCRYLDTLTIS